MPTNKQTYNRLLTEFAKINDKLPKEERLSVSQRRKIVKEKILPKFEGIPQYKLRVKEIKAAISKEYKPKSQKKDTTYNKLLKEFTKINNKLPEERKLSIKERRRIIRENLLPEYEGIPQYKIRVKGIKNAILREYDKVPPREICDINYLDPSDFAFVEWYSLDETISELVPDCVYVKVTAGSYGETNIFNTRNYEYGRRGVREIVEEIRPDADNSSGRFVFAGYRKLRPKKRNDGSPENYYLDFVLFEIDSRGNEKPLGVAETVDYEPPKTRENRKIKTKVKNVIEKKIKQLKAKKDSRRRAKSTLEKNIKMLQQLSKKANKRPTRNNEFLKYKQFNKTAELIEKYKANAKITEKQYDKDLERILKNLS